jgi:hypothetical protein
MKNIILLFALGLISCSTRKIYFSNNVKQRSDVCLWLFDTDKYVYFNSGDLLKFKNIRSRYDSTEKIDFERKASAIFKTRSDTIWMYEIAGTYYIQKDTSQSINSDSISSEIFTDLLYDVLRDKKANIVAKDKSNFLVLKTRRIFPFIAKFKAIYDPLNPKEYIVGKEIWRRIPAHAHF